MTRASESRTYGQHPQRKDQQGEFEIPLNHEAKTIFVLTILLPIACYFLTRGCIIGIFALKPISKVAFSYSPVFLISSITSSGVQALPRQMLSTLPYLSINAVARPCEIVPPSVCR